ncbi:hypothetical protein NIES970_05730 [[Synechococcus] sp. NIES-970]|uniref:DUF5340 domain-containing protein n=1 Tax=Picosynechococcus sp. NKBG15041c TaxID=1407650 RepID=UPI0004063014|nr:DUF5340 domain-containing protein [Picosynechococcus sp. NKBG15041c]BAW95663.1 hypothetical protein NIES970_05730 [[Synechococcus] sp. NIES-970]
MEPLPLPSHIHYETILQILERKSQQIADQDPLARTQIQQLILTVRKALSQQKQLERSCEQLRLPYEHHWSLTNQGPD